ncbi:DUF6338 family protein [Geodermatophilus sp. SYSU D00815]
MAVSVPSSLLQVVALLVLVVPGIVFAAVRRRLKGPVPEDRDFSVRLSRAIAVSVLLDLIYVAALGPMLVRRYGERVADPGNLTDWVDDILPLSGLAFALLLAVPTVLAFALQIRLRRPHLRRDAWSPLYLAPVYHPTPTAWDRAAPTNADCFIRIRTSEGTWVGGWVGSGGRSFVSTYPEPRDIFIEYEWELDDEGVFKRPVYGSRGIFVPLTGSERVSWVKWPAPEEEQPPKNEQPTEAEQLIQRRSCGWRWRRNSVRREP